MTSKKQHCYGTSLGNGQDLHIEETYSPPALGSHSRWDGTTATISGWIRRKQSSSAKFPTTFIHQHTSEMSVSIGNEEVTKLSPILKSRRKKDKSQLEVIQSMPIMRNLKNIDESQVEPFRITTPSWKKVRVDKSQVPSQLLSPSSKLTSIVVPDSPSSVFMSHDDSLLEKIDFDEIDSMYSSLESTPKRKVITVRTKRASLIDRDGNSCRYNLRKTPQRTKPLEDFSVNSSVTRRTESEVDDSVKCESREDQIFDKCEEFHPSKQTWGNSMPRKHNQNVCGVSESSFSSSSSSTVQNIPSCISRYGSSTEQKRVLASPQQFHGRDSPDIFNEEPFDSTNDRLSDSLDAELCLIEEGYSKNCVHDLGKAEIKTKQKLNNVSRVAPLSSACLSDSVIKSPDSQLSFTSTLDSQPLIGRFQDKLKELATSWPSAPLKSDSERRAEAVAAALKEATKTLQSGDDFQLGPFFGLPSKVAEIFRVHRGISDLYNWQEDCINEGIGSHNLLVSLPTSGGKTLVAEILMLRQILLRKLDAVFIMPYVALVQEKVRGLAPFGVELGFLVEEYAGSRGTFPPTRKRKKRVIYVATIEKASGLINALLETGRMEELGLVVVDEVHMLAEVGGRGATLEGILTKMRYAASRVQLVAMSATVGNLQELATFLDAKLFTGNFRPVHLTEHVKIGEEIWEVNNAAHTEEEILKTRRLCCFPYSQEQKRMDADMVAGFVGEVVPDHSCLVFCPTRRNCETLAELLCRVLPRELIKVRYTDKVSLYRALVEEGGGSVCPVLRKTLPYGIAYHHSGLTEGERRLIEEGYLMGTLCCLCCTSTLAAGVNLPARRVIIRSPYTGREFLTRSRYKQMVGRAGRAGLDTMGESYLLLQPQDLKQARLLFLSPLEVCYSTLAHQEDHGLTSLVFSSLGLGIAVSLPKLKDLATFSLLTVQASALEVDVEAKVVEIVESLQRQGLVHIKHETDTQNSGQIFTSKNEGKKETQSPEAFSRSISGTVPLASLSDNAADILCKAITSDDKLTVSRLGRAAIKGSVELSLAGRLYKDLCVARENLAVNSHLHLLYLITPYGIVSSIRINPDVYYTAYMTLGEEEIKVAKLLGITEGVIVRLMMGHKSKKVEQSVLHRFYVALLLHHIWLGMGVWQASELFQVHRGFIQQTLTSSAAFSSCVYHFCQELEELWAFRDLLPTFTRQLSGFCSAELLPLMDLPAVKKGRARRLYNSGYHTLQDIANAEPKELIECVEHLSYCNAVQIISSAKMLLIERAETLQGEADEVLLGLRHYNPHSSPNSGSVRTPTSAANLTFKASPPVSSSTIAVTVSPVKIATPSIIRSVKDVKT